MNGLIRAVREAERQMRELPAAIAGVLRAEGLADRLTVDTNWADRSPFALFTPVAGAAEKAEGAQVREGARPPLAPVGRKGTPAVAAAAGRAGVGAVAAAVGGAGSGGGGGVARAVAGGAAGGIGAALAGGGEAEVPGGGAGAGATEAAVFSLRALRAMSREPGGQGGAPVKTATGPAAVATGLLEAVAAAATVAGNAVGAAAAEVAPRVTQPPEKSSIGTLGSALGRIVERLNAADERARGAGGSAAEGAAIAAAVAGAGAAAARNTNGVAARVPDRGGRPEIAIPGPQRPGELLPPPPAQEVAPRPGEAAGTSSPEAAPPVDPEWVIAVVSDALLEQARRQGVDLT